MQPDQIEKHSMVQSIISSRSRKTFVYRNLVMGHLQ